jgi:hypothetical protein
LALLIALAAPATARAADPTKQQCVAANESAQELRRSGKLREARDKLVYCSVPNCPAAVREDCVQQLAAVDAAMPTVVLEAKDAAGNDLTAVHVTMDGQPFATRLDGTAQSLDPGEHHFVLEAAGFAPAERNVVVHEGDKAHHERIVLGAAAGASANEPAAPGPEAQSPSKSAGVAINEQPAGAAQAASQAGFFAGPGSGQRIAGMAVGGAGVVAIVVGSIFGLASKSTYDHALKSECYNEDPNACSTQGVSDGHTAHGQAAASTVAFAVGLGLLGGGAALYFTAPTGLSVTANASGVAVNGRW